MKLISKYYYITKEYICKLCIGIDEYHFDSFKDLKHHFKFMHNIKLTKETRRGVKK